MSSEASASLRLWLLFPQRLVKKPLIWQLGKDFNITTNIRQATVNDEIGIVSIEITGPHDQLDAGIAWLESQGVKVEPVEVNVVES